MKLTSLRLHGFKSFADRTEIEFHDGITAIVGPNGCGKSNISDAIRWVLGEQRPTAIRGAKMEEAIFQGTVSRRPVHRGSVSMEISNEANVLPVPFEEVEINRTVYRDGGSQYELNRSACRLRDIQDLCRDTGLGANAYAVIENRMIDAILSDRADERRALFEEAAGIGKYKDRRKTASRRLERAEIDVQRLDDLLSEVESKVRSLARQKGRAERYGELRKRRLDVEVTVAARESSELEDRLSRLRGELDGGVRAGESLDAELATAEAKVESLRLEQVEAERGRGEAAARVEELRTRLVEWERELAVAGERASYAGRRLEQIDGERRESREQVEHAESEGGELESRETERTAALEALRSEVAEQREQAEEVRRRLLSAREGMDEVASREREVARRVAQLHGDAEAADGQSRDLELRLEHLEGELAEARAGLAELRSQGDLFEDRLQDLEAELGSARAEVEAADARVNDAREAEDAAREAELAAQDHAGTLETRLEALERMDRDREGMDPVLDSLLADPPPGVVGILADFISADLEVMAAVEAYLGVTSRAVVVRDVDGARSVARWFGEEWSGGGGLVLLPLDRVPAGTPSGSLLERVEASGEGAPWVAALLDGVSFEEEGWPAAAAAANGGGDSVAPDGAIRSGRGILRVGNPLGATGLLERKEELRTLRRDAAAARKRADELRDARVTARERLREAEEALETARGALREREDGQRAARAEESERTDRRTRMERALEDLERQKEAARTGRVRAKERAQAAREELETLSGEEEVLRARRAEAREALERVQEEWEEARGRVSELTVEEARLEGEVERIVERRQELTRRAAAARERLEGLDREESELREELTRVRELREEGEGETRRLLDLRGEATDRLKERDAALETLQEALTGAERQVRDLRSAERKASEDRHRTELEVRELEGKAARIRERLESEWGRSLETLTAEADTVEGEPEELKEELAEIVQRLERLGPVNMLAVEEHEEESARLAFLKEQRSDLVEARDDLRSAIREINQTATRLFAETFEGIRENFRDTFLRLFEGGECDVWLEDPADPLESAIEIQASPRGKRTQRIDLLSGGERALTALSLLFGIYLVKPSPFCVLDEVDAPLDESNIGRFIRLLQEFKHQTQFIVITHNPRTIEAADWIYGVTMEEPGVSSIVGVRLEEALEATAV